MPWGVFIHTDYTKVVGVTYTIDNYRCNGLLYTYRREASALLVLLQWACQSLEKRNEQQVQVLTLFRLYNSKKYPAESGNL